MSHVAALKEENQRVQKRLLVLMNQPEEWLYQLIYERGMAWLESHYGFDPNLQYALGSDSLYWAWWKNTWASQDMELEARLRVTNGLACYSAGLSGGFLGFQHPEELEQFYKTRHEPAKLKVYLPPSVVELVKRGMRDQAQQHSVVAADLSENEMQNLLNKAL